MIPAQTALDPQQSWLGWLVVCGALAAIVIILCLINRLLPERLRKGFTAGAGNALMQIDALYRPSRKHVIEAKQQERKEEEDEGGPERAGKKQESP